MPLKATWSGCQYGPHGIDKQTLRAVPGVGSAFGTTQPTLAQGPAFCRSWDPGLCPLQATSLPPWGLAGKGVATWASVLCSPPGRVNGGPWRPGVTRIKAGTCRFCHLNSPSISNFCGNRRMGNGSEAPGLEACGLRCRVGAMAPRALARCRPGCGIETRLRSIFRKLEKRGASEAEMACLALTRLGFRFRFRFRRAGSGADRSHGDPGGRHPRRAPLPGRPESRFLAGVGTERPRPPPGPGRQPGPGLSRGRA